jgi:hypothetical protein
VRMRLSVCSLLPSSMLVSGHSPGGACCSTVHWLLQELERLAAILSSNLPECNTTSACSLLPWCGAWQVLMESPCTAPYVHTMCIQCLPAGLLRLKPVTGAVCMHGIRSFAILQLSAVGSRGSLVLCPNRLLGFSLGSPCGAYGPEPRHRPVLFPVLHVCSFPASTGHIAVAVRPGPSVLSPFVLSISTVLHTILACLCIPRHAVELA